MERIIKRYGNRKLYDPQDRTYVSLEDIAVMIRNGETIRVIEKSSEADITTQTLTQVIFEEGKKGRNPLPSEVLHDVIRLGNSVLDEGLQQIRRGIELVPDSLNKLFSRPSSDEVEKLRSRIESLELMIERLTKAGAS